MLKLKSYPRPLFKLMRDEIEGRRVAKCQNCGAVHLEDDIDDEVNKASDVVYQCNFCKRLQCLSCGAGCACYKTIGDGYIYLCERTRMCFLKCKTCGKYMNIMWKHQYFCGEEKEEDDEW